MAGNSVGQMREWLGIAASRASEMTASARAKLMPLWRQYKPTTPAGWTALAGVGCFATALLSILLVAALGVLTAVAWTSFTISLVLAVIATTGVAVGGSAALGFAAFASVLGCAVLAAAGVLSMSKQVLRRTEGTYSWGIRHLQDTHEPTSKLEQPSSSAREYKDSSERVAGSMFPKLATDEATAAPEEPQPGTPPPVSTLLPTRAAGGSPPEAQPPKQQAAAPTADTAKLEAVLTKPLNAEAPAFQATTGPVGTAYNASETSTKPASAPNASETVIAAQGGPAPQQRPSKDAPKGVETAVKGALPQGAAAVLSQEASNMATKETRQQGGASSEGTTASMAVSHVATPVMAGAGLASPLPGTAVGQGRSNAPRGNRVAHKTAPAVV